MRKAAITLPLVALCATFAACSPADDTQAPDDTASIDAPAPGPAPSSAPTDVAGEAPAANVLTLEGLGGLTIGQPVPAGSSWNASGAQASDSCIVYASSEYPGAYAIVEGGAVRRVSVGQRSDVKLIEGIGAGASEAEVKAAFPGFVETPHKYVEAPGKYLTAPNGDSGDSALRFEIGADGKVSQMHVGTAPVLGYVEACS